ncbi:hypothetical protein RSW37_26010, partial [Escherichia coli]|uniref:hypothetical protein n=1 Tax=Escherichia coli TaxID=562 RepID=UPI0028DF84E3|nr:hypothetical protein [Escherichia coli]
IFRAKIDISLKIIDLRHHHTKRYLHVYTQTCLHVLFRTVRYKFRKVRNIIAGKDASMLEQQFEDFEQQKRRDHQVQDQS